MLKEISIAIVALIAVVGISGVYLVSKAQQETVTPLRTLNPTSSGPKAIVIYSPGVSDFH